MSAILVSSSRPVLITGGAGFIGANLADRLLGAGKSVIVFDDLSRAGVERNLEYLRSKHGAKLELVIADVRDPIQVRSAVRRASAVFHFAAQVAVTTSLEEPRRDFEVNALGTLNVLEAVRETNRTVPILYTSTNKVYGAIDDVELEDSPLRCEPSNVPKGFGFDETRALDFHSPYGCSKGSADQLVRDYSRSYGLNTVVFRMSCIYGPLQFGNEDQGWVAHFVRCALRGEPITIFGDGRQVRDVLFVSDLMNAMLLAQKDAKALAGTAFNMGGGPANTLSLLELVHEIERHTGRSCKLRFERPRIGDQRYYVSDVSKFTRTTDWVPAVDPKAGVARLIQWLSEQREPARIYSETGVLR
jgi:CDP-paratose 2-epimerase